MAPVKEMQLQPAVESQSNGLAALIDRYAADANCEPAKLQMLLEMQERVMAHNAEAAFNRDFARMQTAMPVINEAGNILNKQAQVQSRYARFEDIQAVTKPILQAHGFAMSYRSEWPDKHTVKVVGILTHIEGHSRTSEFMSDADTSGAKNAVQGLGSAVSYGRRYTTIDLLNIETRGLDRDGAKDEVADPPGFEEWATDFTATADMGWPALRGAWNQSKPEFRDHMTKHYGPKLEGLKAKARQVQA